MAAEARKQQKLYFVYAQKDEVFKQEIDKYPKRCLSGARDMNFLIIHGCCAL